MNLLYYSSRQQPLAKQELLSVIQTALPSVNIRIFNDCGSLHEWLSVPPRDFLAAVLSPADSLELVELITLKDFFMDRKIILSITPESHIDHDLTHKLDPQYILYCHEDFQGIHSVLEKWLAAMNTWGEEL